MRFAHSSEPWLDHSAEELFEHAPCGYLATTPDGTFIRVNETFLRWTGHRREELVGIRRFQDLLSVGGRIYHETHYAPMLRMQGAVREIAVEIVTAAGERLPALVNSVLVHDESGEPRVVRTTVFDATERRRYERELLAARDRERHGRELASDVALVLQRSLLGGAPPQDPRYEVATLYQPAVATLEVGGDWHDTFALRDGRVGIVVGDVVGRGLHAASAMGQLRSAVRALAGAGMPPAELLGHLDTFVAQVEPARYATLVYAEADPDTGEVAMASAGHLPAVTPAPSSEPQLFMEGRATPLGVRAERAESRFTLAPGAGFLLYTDGLVERRGEPIDVGLERLLAAIGAAPDASPSELVEALPRVLLEPDAPDDDVCLLSFRLSA
jgi:sigma-B regulation protein RsbU (phosphoserine phosphatase)